MTVCSKKTLSVFWLWLLKCACFRGYNNIEQKEGKQDHSETLIPEYEDGGCAEEPRVLTSAQGMFLLEPARTFPLHVFREVYLLPGLTQPLFPQIAGAEGG